MSSRRPLKTQVKAKIEVIGFSPVGAQKERCVEGLYSQASVFRIAAQHGVVEQAPGWTSRAPPEGFLCDLGLITYCAVPQCPHLCHVGADRPLL